jgi:hypothetical protein
MYEIYALFESGVERKVKESVRFAEIIKHLGIWYKHANNHTVYFNSVALFSIDEQGEILVLS